MDKNKQTALFNVDKKRKNKQDISNTSKNTLAFGVSPNEYSAYYELYTRFGMSQGELLKIAFDRMMKDVYENGVKHFMENK